MTECPNRAPSGALVAAALAKPFAAAAGRAGPRQLAAIATADLAAEASGRRRRAARARHRRRWDRGAAASRCSRAASRCPGARDQRRRQSASSPVTASRWCRGGRRLLRRARPSSRAASRRPRRRRGGISMRGWPRSDGEGLDAILDDGVGLRHGDEGLWLHAARRSGLCGKAARVAAQTQRHFRIHK